jgi:hypothetical protein
VALPDPPKADKALFAGIVGDEIDTFEPFTEASPESIATQFVVAFGNAVGRGPHFFLGETPHHSNEFLVICGRTSVGRKGDGGSTAIATFKAVDEPWFNALGPGLSSGEGLIACVRDPVVKTKQSGKDAGQSVVIDEGVADKRFLAYETEFAQVLKHFTREGNTLSNVLREAFDGRYVLRSRTKNDPQKATGAHISVIGHTTPEDLTRYLADVEIANGLANRFLYVYVQREKLLPNPRRASSEQRKVLADKLSVILAKAQARGQMFFSPATEAVFAKIYPKLSCHRPGLVGQIQERCPAHLRRLALIYALLAGSEQIESDHLESALAFWVLCEKSIGIIFGDRTGNDTLDRILAALAPGEAMKLEEIRREVFSGHVTAGRMRGALELGVELGTLSRSQQDTDGRSATLVTRCARAEKAA